MLLVITQQMQAQLKGVLAALVGQFIEERFVEKVVEGVTHRAPVAEHRRAFDVELGDAFVGNGVGFARQAFEGRWIELFALLAGDGGLSGNAHAECTGLFPSKLGPTWGRW